MTGAAETGPAGTDCPQWSPALTLGVPALVALVVGLVGITNRQVWQDELATWWASTIPGADFWDLVRLTDVVFIPYYLLMRGWVALAGDSALALRIPALVAMAGAAALVAALGRRLFTAPVGLVAGLVFALLPGVSRYAQEARPYALVVAGAAGSTLLLLRATDRSIGARWVGYGLAAAATVGLHVLALPLLLAHAVWAWRQRRVRPFIAAAVPAALPGLVLLGLALAWHQSAQVNWIDTPWWSILTVLNDMLFSYLIPPLMLALIVVAIVRRRRGDPGAVWLLGVWAIAPILLLFALRPVADLFIHRYLLFVLPAWALLTAAALVDLYGWLRRRLRAGPTGVVAAAGLLLLAALALPGHAAARTDPFWQPDFRGLAGTVHTGLRPGDAIAFSGSSWNERLSFAYALRPPAAPRDVFLSRPQRLGTYAAPECEHPAGCLGDPPRIWYVTGTDTDPFAGLPAEKAELLRERFQVVRTYRANRATLLLLEPR